MEQNLFDTKFTARYAVRVMERQSRLFRHIDYLVKAVSFLSGTAAFAAIVTQHGKLSLLIGLILAIAQAVNFIIRPAERAIEARIAARPYREFMLRFADMDTESAQRALNEIQARDEVIAIEALRVRAYNDVLTELGCSESAQIAETRATRCIAALA